MLTCRIGLVQLPFKPPALQPKHKKSHAIFKSSSNESISAQRTQKGAVLILPGFLFGSSQYQGLATSLRQRGYIAEIVPITAREWSPLLFGGDFQWYLRRIDTSLTSLYEQHGQVALVGHSAGGWVPRILLGDVPYQGNIYHRLHMAHTLVTLGTPHGSIEAYPLGRIPEKLYLDGINEKDKESIPEGVFGSSLQFANYFYPRGDCFPGVKFVCIASDAIHGERPPWRRKGNEDNDTELPLKARSFSQKIAQMTSAIQNGHSKSWFAYESYKSGCGHGDVSGDSVTPLCISHLPGAENVTLKAFRHGPTSSRDRPWYGDEEGIEQWIQYIDR